MSAMATLNGNAVLSFNLHMPLQGPWHADVCVDSPEATTGKATLVINDMAFIGHLRRGGVEAETGAFRMVGGNGGFIKDATAKHYKNATVNIVLEDILRAAGETLSLHADTTITTSILENWATLKRPCGKCLYQLAEAQGASWRVLADGTTWVGIEVWPLQQGNTLFIRQVMHKTDFMAFYPCSIVAQNADGTLELKADSLSPSPKFSPPPTTSVPMLSHPYVCPPLVVLVIFKS